MSKANKRQGRSNTINIGRQVGISTHRAIATTATKPTVQAAITATTLLSPHFNDTSLNELTNLLSEHVKQTQDGDLSLPEAMLVSQAQTLDLLFNRLTRQAVGNIGSYPETVGLYMKLALRAQSQCRAVAEALHEMKYPKPVAFFQQANIANGPQQINNAQAPASRAGEIEKAPNELLEQTHGQRLDDGAAGQAIGANSHLEAVGAVHGPKVSTG